MKNIAICQVRLFLGCGQHGRPVVRLGSFADLHNGIASEPVLLALGIPVAASGAAWNIGSF